MWNQRSASSATTRSSLSEAPASADLDALLADLARGRGRARVEEPGEYEPSGRVSARSATVRHSHGAKHDTAPVWHAGPAGARGGDRVAVAVVAELLDRERVPRRLALVPELLARAAVELRLARLAREPHRLVVHPREHQHAAGLRVLDDRRAQLAAQAASRSGTPSARSSSRSGREPRRILVQDRREQRRLRDPERRRRRGAPSPAPPDAITGIDTASATAP